MKLLRVLQEREIERLGGTAPIKVNVRLIAATHRPLENLIEEGTFRDDLYYRLAVFTIFAPPLRERKPDIMLLADHFLEQLLARARQAHPPDLDAGDRHAHQLSLARQRPRAREHDRARGAGLRRRRHPRATTCRRRCRPAETSDTVPRQSLTESVGAFERDLLQDALKTTRGNCARAARLLDTTERIFNYKVRKYGIDARRFRA